MDFFRRIIEKIKSGWLRELGAELRWMWQYVRRYRLIIAVHILLGVVGILLSLASSVASKYLIDAVTGYHAGAIGAAAGYMVGMLAGNILMKSISGRVGAVLSIRVHNEIQREVYRRILGADWQTLETFRSGDLLSRLNSDVSTLSGGVIGFIPSLISALVQFLGAFAIILYYDPTMALIALIGVPVSALCSRVMVRRMREHNRRMKEIGSDVMSFQQDSFQNLTSIKAFGIAGHFCRRMEALQGTYQEAYLAYNLFSVRASAFLSVVGTVVSMSCFGWGVYRLWAGAITFGSMTLFLQLASVLSASFSSLVGLVPTLISLSTSAGRIMAVTELPEEKFTPAPWLRDARAVSICLDHVDFSYQGGEAILSDVSITAAPGDLIAFTGPSGEGKTTLLRILLGLVRPTDGTAELTGADGERCPLSAATRDIFGYVPQGSSLFAGTIRENLTLAAPSASDREIWEALDIACAGDFVRALPQRLDHQVGGRTTGLSEGQGQRLAIARAILRGAPVLLLDEATSALDERTEQALLTRLMSSGRIRTCLLVTHRPGALRYCTRIYRVSDGRITEAT